MTHYFKIGWADNEPAHKKLDRLLKKIDYLQRDGKTVSLVGISAGAGMAVIAFSKRKAIHKVVLVGGKINNPQAIGETYFKINPAFKKSAFRVADALNKLDKSDRKKIMSIHPKSDGTVPIEDTIIEGALKKQVPAAGHVTGIVYTITVGSAIISKFIKS